VEWLKVKVLGSSPSTAKQTNKKTKLVISSRKRMTSLLIKI
jgi:hypothetical protein